MALLPFMSSGLTNAAAGASEDAALTGTPPVAQGPESTAQLMKLLGGDLSGSLTGGDKLLALAALMRSATRSGRRAGLTPQQVMGQLQQQKVAEVQNRLMVEQMRAKMAQERQLNAAWQDYVTKQPEARQAKLAGIVDPQERQKILAAEPKPFQLTKSNGRQFMVFANPDGSTSTVDLGLPEDVEGEWKDYDYDGDGVTESVFVNKRNGEPIFNDAQQALVVEIGSTPAQIDASTRGWANIGISRERLTHDKAGGGGRTEKQPVRITVNGEETFGVPLGGFQYRLADGQTVTGTPAKSSSAYRPPAPPQITPSGPRYQQ